MVRVISTALKTRLDAGRIIKSDLVLFDFPSGLWGFFYGSGTFTYNSVTYIGAGAMFEIDAIGGVSDGSAVQLDIKLNANAAKGLTMTVLATIEQEIYAGRPVTISRGYFDADTYELISVEVIYRGYIDTIEHVESDGEGQLGAQNPGEGYIVAHVESRSLDLGRSGWRRRSDSDQRSLAANDGSLRYLQASATAEIFWGRKTPARARA
jgi:hypothetical protein